MICRHWQQTDNSGKNWLLYALWCSNALRIIVVVVIIMDKQLWAVSLAGIWGNCPRARCLGFFTGILGLVQFVWRNVPVKVSAWNVRGLWLVNRQTDRQLLISCTISSVSWARNVLFWVTLSRSCCWRNWFTQSMCLCCWC